MSEKTLLYINNHATPAAKDMLLALNNGLPPFGVSIKTLEYPVPPIDRLFTQVVVLGGDGSVKTVADRLMEQRFSGVLAIIPGGSQNGIYKSLLDEGITISKAQLKRGINAHIPDFYPGMIDNKYFYHMTAWGKREVAVGDLTEQLRGLPIGRINRARMATALITLKDLILNTHMDPVFEYVGTSRFIGDYPLPVRQKLYDKDLMKVQVNGGDSAEVLHKMLVAAFTVASGGQPPKGLLTTIRQPVFEVFTSGRGCVPVTSDGETDYILSDGFTTIQRAELPIKIAAYKA